MMNMPTGFIAVIFNITKEIIALNMMKTTLVKK